MDAAHQIERRWWERRSFVVLLIFLATLPILWPDFPPLVDLQGHMGRYKVQLNPDDVALAQFYSFEWKLIANLGADILIIPFASLFGIELGTKLIVILTMAAASGGLLWIARELHGRIPPTAAFAIPLLYGYVTTYGFINYMLSMALALNVFALWMYLERTGRVQMRLIVMIPLSFIVAITHIYGWGVLGILIFGREFMRAIPEGVPVQWRSVLAAVWKAGLRCLPLCGPILLFILWRSDSSGGAEIGGWFAWEKKALWIVNVLHDRNLVYDRLSAILLLLLLLRVIFSPSLRFARDMKPAIVILCLLFIVFPKAIFGSLFSDMRLVPYIFAIAIISIAPPTGLQFRTVQWIAVAALAFCVVRIGGATVSYAKFDADIQRELKALDVMPENARLLSFVNDDCGYEGTVNRKGHLPSLALVRNNAYANDQWAADGAQLLRSKINAPGYEIDGSQFLPSRLCGQSADVAAKAIFDNIPRDKFDYVWLIDIPAYNSKLLSGVTPIWSNGTSAVYKIDGASQAEVASVASSQ